MPESVYRCAECGHGKHLMAWAPANAYGPLAAGGDLDRYDDVDNDGIHEDSIQCSTHPDGPIEKRVDGKWCRWWNCPNCKGTGRTHVGEHWKAPDGYPCHVETFKVSNQHGSWFVHAGWFPAKEVEEATGLKLGNQ